MSVYRKGYKGRNGSSARTATFYVQFRDHMDRVRLVSGFKDKTATRELDRKLVRLVALRSSGAMPDEATRRWIEGLAPALRDRLAKFGLITAQQVAGLRPLVESLDAWAEHLRADGRSPRYVLAAQASVRRVLDGTGAKHWTDLDASRVENYLRAEREKENGIGARTSNSLLGAARQFCRWAVRTGLATEDPLRILKPRNIATDRRRERRALTRGEMGKLLTVVERGPERDGISGPERALIYRFAAETGLRRGEIVTLTVGDLDLADLAQPTVRVQAANAKNKKESRLSRSGPRRRAPWRPSWRAGHPLPACSRPRRTGAPPRRWQPTWQQLRSRQPTAPAAS